MITEIIELQGSTDIWYQSASQQETAASMETAVLIC